MTKILPLNRKLPAAIMLLLAVWWPATARAGVSAGHDLRFDKLATVWDEGIPLGNGMLGALVWRKGDKLRLSLDRADLWDLRRVAEFERPEFRFSWVREQVLAGTYGRVQDLFDLPYERDPAPTKIPAGAIEFPVDGFGEVKEVRLRLEDATCRVTWSSGATFTSFISATGSVGWFRFENLPTGSERPAAIPLMPTIVPPPYGRKAEGVNGFDTAGGAVSSLNPSDLARLGYPAPQVTRADSSGHYTQVCYGGMRYDVYIAWRTGAGGTLEGAWSIVSAYPPGPGNSATAEELVTRSLVTGYDESLRSHARWWKDFWAKSGIQLPDTLLETQWFREIYKFGSASRKGAPPITLQAVWTADNGKLPPWKGDFHNDLNTQLSYWPGYSSNHLAESEVFTDWLWKNRPEFERYTRLYYSAPGLNVPGVSTLDGAPMGGWIQYANSPTVSAWLAQHFYLQWRYGMDREFLRDRAWPWLRDAATFIDSISIVSPDGKRSLPLSSSPEINDNDVSAWFLKTTNFDLALIRWLYGAAAELAEEMGLGGDARRLLSTLSEWPDLATDSADHRLLVAPGVPLGASHRHFSHLMAIHPLGILDRNRSDADRMVIEASLADLRRLGPAWWTGYSYAWYGCLAARARDGERAADALRTFATSFILPNGFHVNGDQSKSGKSNFTYRPFTLEGNFAFAQGIQEMLLQSQSDTVRVFPAVPGGWKDVSFRELRAEGAFLVSAKRVGGSVREVSVRSEKGGILVLENPFAAGYDVAGVPERRVRGGEGVITADLEPGETIVFTPGR